MGRKRTVPPVVDYPLSMIRTATFSALILVAGILTSPYPAGAEPRVEEGQTLYFDVAIPETPRAGCKIDYNYFTQSGSAMQGTDFKATQGKLVFLSGDQTKRIGVVTLSDECLEKDDETVILVVCSFLEIPFFCKV